MTFLDDDCRGGSFKIWCENTLVHISMEEHEELDVAQQDIQELLNLYKNVKLEITQ